MEKGQLNPKDGAETNQEWDWIIIGTGMGGSTFGHALAKAGRRVLFIEKGADQRVNRQKKSGTYLESLIPLPARRNEDDYKNTGRSHTKIWDATRNRWLKPILGSGTGGSTALFGMVMERFWKEDFDPDLGHTNSPPSQPNRWPLTYDEMDPHYSAAEQLYGVTSQGTDPLRRDHAVNHLPPRPALSQEGIEIMAALQGRGLHPYTLPMARQWGTPCRFCQSFLCSHDCKNDAAKVCLEPALHHGASLLAESEVLEITSQGTRVTGVKVRVNGEILTLPTRNVALAAGALLSPVLLLKSRSSEWPQGLANGSGQVGKNLMRHYIELLGIPSHGHSEEFSDQKEIGLNDFYLRDGQKFGTVADFGAMPPVPVILEDLDNDVAANGLLLKTLWRLIRPLARWGLQHIVKNHRFMALIIEDLPFQENRVEEGSAGADIAIHYSIRPEEWSRIRQARALARKALGGWKVLLLSNAKNTKLLAHACGTCRMGDDPATSVVNRFNRAHGVENLYMVDASVFPSSAGVNPALTIAANALRVAQHIIETNGDAPEQQKGLVPEPITDTMKPVGEKSLGAFFVEGSVAESRGCPLQERELQGEELSVQERPRILFIADAVALSHPARLLEIAQQLDPETYEIHFAVDPRYAAVLGPLPFPTHPVESIPSDQFDRAVTRGGVFFTEKVIEKYVRQERALFVKIRPNAVVGEFRPSLGISARLAGIPYINVLNAYYNPAAQIRHILPEYSFFEWVPRKFAQKLFDLFRSWGYARHGRPVNAVRKRHGLAPLKGDLRHVLADGDWTLFPDLEQLFSKSPYSKNQRYMAPISWAPKVPLPSWWDSLPSDRPVVYANLGSSGKHGILQKVLDALSILPITVIAATAGRQPDLVVPANAFITDFLPGQDAVKRSALVITNGGNMSGYQALAEGKPILGLASNVDQFLNMAVLEDAGVGKLLRASSFSKEALRSAVNSLINDKIVKEKTRIMNTRIAMASKNVFRSVLDQALGLTGKTEKPKIGEQIHEKMHSGLHNL